LTEFFDKRFLIIIFDDSPNYRQMTKEIMKKKHESFINEQIIDKESGFEQ